MEKIIAKVMKIQCIKKKKVMYLKCKKSKNSSVNKINVKKQM